MVRGRRYWIVIWYGILLLGLLGLWASIYWGRQTRWKNLDELLRAIGTITVSVGMLLLLNRVAESVGQVLLVVSLISFVLAFIYGRKHLLPGRDPGPDDDQDEPRSGA
jgi:vacuolar-type H+-ATPase subunit I/STV1